MARLCVKGRLFRLGSVPRSSPPSSRVRLTSAAGRRCAQGVRNGGENGRRRYGRSKVAAGVGLGGECDARRLQRRLQPLTCLGGMEGVVVSARHVHIRGCGARRVGVRHVIRRKGAAMEAGGRDDPLGGNCAAARSPPPLAAALTATRGRTEGRAWTCVPCPCPRPRQTPVDGTPTTYNLIRGFRVRSPGGPPVLTWHVTESSRTPISTPAATVVEDKRSNALRPWQIAGPSPRRRRLSQANAPKPEPDS
jgi:hypothetical protein